jgi:uncharacterized repeat protein (TIGR01451 family)
LNLSKPESGLRKPDCGCNGREATARLSNRIAETGRRKGEREASRNLRGRLGDVGLSLTVLMFNLRCFGVARASFFTGLVLLTVTALASGQTAPHKPLPTEPLEEYDDPPAPFPLRGMGVSPGMVSVHDQFTSHQVNVNGSGMNITGDAANEPSIAVDPTDHNRMVIGWRQFDSVTSNFRQGGWGWTNNGGATWTFPGVLESGVFRSDPVLDADDTGRFFFLSLLQSFDVTLWRSLNGGQTFTNIAPAKGGDKQWFVIDNTATSTGHGFQYQFWDNASPFAPGEFSRSTDGGFTWMDPITIPNAPQWGTPDVDSNGILFFGGVTTSKTQFWCLRSSNAKNGAVIPTFDQSTQVNMGGVISYFDTVNPEGLIGQVFLATDRSGTSTNNNVYMLASVQPTGFNTGSDVMFVRSTNGGQTFSAPKRVNDDPINHSKWHWFGTLAVAPNGRIDSVWFDTRNAANNTDSQLFYSYSTDAGVTWSPNIAVSNTFNPFLGYPQQNKLGDYMTIVSDNTGADVAYAATFNSEQDVYYVRVAPGVAPTPTPSPTATATVPPTPTPTPSSPTPTATATVSPTPSEAPFVDIGVIKADSPDPVQVGQNLTYTITVSNGSPNLASNVTMTDTLPASVNFVSVIPSQGNCGGTSTVNCSLGQLPAFSSATVTLVVTPTIAGPLSNTATAPYPVLLDPSQSNNSSTASTTVLPAGTPTPTPAPAAQAVNLSTRMRVQTGDNVGIGGFIIAGSAPKHVLLRGLGPSITGVSGVLADPVLELHGPGAFPTITNDNWRDDPAQEAAILATGIAPTNNLESAIEATLNPGAYTAVVRGKNNTSGLGLVEVYDLSQAVLAKLANISTRAFVSTGDNIVIAGFVLGSHSGNDRIVVRGIGPSLAALGVSNTLADPMLELRDSNGALLMANNDWQENGAQAAELTAAGLAPTNPLESGIAATLPPGVYTALLSGLNNGSGVGLVEVYDRGP